MSSRDTPYLPTAACARGLATANYRALQNLITVPGAFIASSTGEFQKRTSAFSRLSLLIKQLSAGS